MHRRGSEKGSGARKPAVGLHQLADSALSDPSPSPRGCGDLQGSLGLLANERRAFSRFPWVWALVERVFKSRQIPAAAAGPLLLPAPFLWAGAGEQMTLGRIRPGLQSPSAGNGAPGTGQRRWTPYPAPTCTPDLEGELRALPVLG